MELCKQGLHQHSINFIMDGREPIHEHRRNKRIGSLYANILNILRINEGSFNIIEDFAFID